jgi:predicted O-methyltransferase YrrM
MPKYDPIMDYALKHTTEEDAILASLYRETHLMTVYPQMISGPWQGRLLTMISQMIRPSRILEIGTFTGYSAICLAKGLSEEGILHTIEINDELVEIAQNYIRRAGFVEKIVLHNGDACQLIPSIEEDFDLVFIDGDKEQYLTYFELIVEKVRPGGFILADNVLWGGKVMQAEGTVDKETRGIISFNSFVMQDTRVEKLFLPVRDGVFILRKHNHHKH